MSSGDLPTSPLTALLYIQGGGFEIVHVSDKNEMVWAVDKGGNVFVRKGVTPDLPIGTAWIPIAGKATTQYLVYNRTQPSAMRLVGARSC